MIAVREIIANALVHRDYESPDSCVHVRLFDDRLEVSSPGSWLNWELEPDVEYSLSSLQRQSVKRNFRLAHILSGIRLVEGDGSGIPSALKDCEVMDNPAPIVRADDHFVHVIIRRKEPDISGPVVSQHFPGSAPSGSSGSGASLFRDRHEEVDRLLRGLTDTSGPHFWLVISPPQLGKTWLLEQLRTDLAAREPARWTTRLVNMREHPAEVRGNAHALLARLFAAPASAPTSPHAVRGIARDISRSGKSYLCILDSAELLEDQVIETLRSYLGQIQRMVEEARNTNVRLALIVASRKDRGWLGVVPTPRFAALRLTEFRVDVVDDALRQMASQMGRTFSPSEYARLAQRVYHVSEGLPVVLERCLKWIREQEWLGPELLESREVFEELTRPYVRDVLLSPSSLFLQPLEQPEETSALRHVLEHAFRVLSPYRLFTQSHLRHHLESDDAFRDAALQLGWSTEDIWMAVSGTALLSRPQREPWQAIEPAIRRLLCRYWYFPDARLAQAHRDAGQFVRL